MPELNVDRYEASPLTEAGPQRRSECCNSVVKEEGTVSHAGELRAGKVLVVEDATTASLVVVARDLKDRDGKVAVPEEIIRKLRT
jgi:hypothetical protein